jgi:hypothetical protein
MATRKVIKPPSTLNKFAYGTAIARAGFSAALPLSAS